MATEGPRLLTMLLNVYLTYYAIGSRFARSQWPREINELKGVAVLGFVQWLFILALCGWIQIIVDRPTLFDLGRWQVILVAVALLGIDYLTLVRSGRGTAYEREFEKLSAKTRLWRYVCCVLGVLIALALVGGSIIAYRNAYMGQT
jgi:hypothetical protein